MATRIPVWTTADGRQIPVSKMQSDHLLNTHRVLRRRIAADTKAMSDIAAEMQIRGLSPLDDSSAPRPLSHYPDERHRRMMNTAFSRDEELHFDLLSQEDEH